MAGNQPVRLLLISQHYAPELTGNAPYATGLAEQWARLGHEVIALTGLPHYPAWRVYDGYRGHAWSRESIHGVDVRRRWHFVPNAPTAAQRSLHDVSFLMTGLSALALPRPDAVLGIVPSLSGGLLAQLAAKRFGVSYGLVLQDLVGQAALGSGVSGGARVARTVRAVEGWVARGAAAIGIIAEGFRPYVESLGVDPRRIQRVRNWSHIAEPTLARTAARERLGLASDALLCLHTGNMGSKQGLENVVECARLALRSNPELLFVLMGDGNQRPYLEALASRYALPNLRLLPMQPPELYPSILAAADILLVNQQASVIGMSLPSKLTSYFAVGRPVVAAVGATSEAAREVEASGGGLIVAPDQPRALLDALLALANDGPLRERIGACARAWSISALSKDSALEGYNALLDAVLVGRSGKRTRARTRMEVRT